MKKLLSLLLIATLTAAVGWAADETIVFSEQGFTNGQAITSVEGQNFTITFNKGANSNAPKYYNSSGTSSIRVYGGNFFTISSSTKSIEKIEITFDTGENSNEITTDVGTYSNSNGIWIGKAESITFTVSGTSGHRRLSAIAVTYTTAPPISTVTGIAEFKELEPGTIAQLYLPDSYYARVTHVETKGDACDAYIRDNDGALRLTGISPNRNMAYNQHIAGYITGKYTIGSDGLPQLEPVADLTNTAYLVIADRVTEANTMPKPIDSEMIDYHLADWVTINEVKVNNNVNGVYNGAIVDVNAIVADANGTLHPVDDREDANPITYVIDSQENFVSPPSPIQKAQVRLKRILTTQDWSLLTLPFDVNNFNGEVLEYKDLTFGEIGTYEFEGVKYPIESGILHFDYYNGIMHAGTPYMAKPSGAQNLTFKGVTLSNTNAGSVTKHLGPQNTAGINLMDNEDPIYVGDYSLVGTYSPMTLPVDKKTIKLVDSSTWSWTELLKELDESYDSNIAGTEAYITVPDGAGIKIELADVGTITSINSIKVDGKAPQHVAVYNIMGVRMTLPLSQLPPGIYIVNGKKIVKF